MKILIIVPAYNEEESLPGVIRDLHHHVSGADIIVVNDGSRDRTPHIAGEMGVKVINLPFNLGIGGAMQAGYRYAEKHGYDVAVQFDGDGQHLANEIEKLLQPVAADRADLAIGSRFLVTSGYAPSIFRKAGILFFSFMLSRILRMRVTDATSGFRAANRKVIDFFARSYPEDYPEVETIVLLHKIGLRITEVPVMMRQRSVGQSSITPIRSLYYMVKVFLAVSIDCLKKRGDL